MDATEPLMTQPEPCNYLNVARRTVYAWRRNGELPYIQFGGAIRFRRSDVERFLRRHTSNVYLTAARQAAACGSAR